MKIVDKRTTKTVDFRSLAAGEVFYFPTEEWYGLKLSNETQNGEDAVDIETGELAMLCARDQVVKLAAQLEIL